MFAVAGDGQNVTRTDPEPNQETEVVPAENESNAENRISPEERSDGAAARMLEASESNEDSNPRESFTPYFMFDDDHEVRPCKSRSVVQFDGNYFLCITLYCVAAFQGQGNSEEMAEEEESCEQLVTIDMNAPSQVGIL